MKTPPRSILDPSFQYVPSVETDLRRTFARVRRELRKQGKPAPEPNRKVIPIARRTA
jgi:hypothetical protein